MVIENKKAQQFSITTLIVIIVGVVALILVILGLTTGFDKTLGRFAFFGGSDLQTFAINCQQIADAHDSGIDLSIDYCTDFKKIKLASGEKIYANCEYGDVGVTSSITCGGDAPLEAFCAQKGLTEGKPFKINDKTCNPGDTTDSLPHLQ